MRITNYAIYSDKISRDMRIACVSDIHGRLSDDAVEAVAKIKPDLILLAGDILEISVDYMILQKKHQAEIDGIGIHTVNDRFERYDDVAIGGLVCGYDKVPDCDKPDFDLDFLKSFDRVQGFKILLCHYPHYYPEILKDSSFDLIVSGHAHGGQWRLFGRGVYAPHQGLFPKYTSGIIDDRFIISRGAANNVSPIPRFFNPCEVMEIDLISTAKK